MKAGYLDGFPENRWFFNREMKWLLLVDKLRILYDGLVV